MNEQLRNTRRISLPENLQPLNELAKNMYWAWNRKIRHLFEIIDPATWIGVGRNPVLLLQKIGQSRLQELSTDESFLDALDEAVTERRGYLENLDNTWFRKTYGALHQDYSIAYFSAEFGVASCLRTYSGGLGILAGDHIKSASDLGIPIVGVGLFYKRGYFSQGLTHDGWQTETYPENEPSEIPIEPVTRNESEEPLIISVHLLDRQVRVRAWKVSVGRIPLYLLDTNLPGLNSKEDCEITSELYGGDSETRIKQEIILGFAGVRLLRAIGIRPSLIHMNEGHCAFATLERIKEIMEDDSGHSYSFSQALCISRAGNLFTTHTPVPAGIDIFTSDLVERYLGDYAKKVGMSLGDLFALGQENPNSAGFNMAVLAIRLSTDVNAVSQLHRDVVRKIWDQVLKEQSFELDENEPKQFKGVKRIGSVTNGIHIPSWISDSMTILLDNYLGKDWTLHLSDPDVWKMVYNIPPEVLWEVRCAERERLVKHIQNNFQGFGKQDALDPNALTIGFARRFATYKRATLIFSDHHRLEKILRSNDRPVQIIFSGKAHSRDFEGKKLIQDIFNRGRSLESTLGKTRVVFLNDYDISIARILVQGVDVWLNNPRRPFEACGTSGMKVLANGGLNLSILDGWWDEGYAPDAGWAIGGKKGLDVSKDQDREDAQSLYNVLEQQVIPEFYDRTNDVPLRWVERMKNSIATLSPRFNTHRMVIEYAQRFYFKHIGDNAHLLNRSELGVDFLEEAQTDWETREY